MDLLGRILSSRIGFALIKAYATRRHHSHLYDPDGSLYMGRWRVVDDYKRDIYNRDTEKRTLASKVLEFLTGYQSIRLHHIARPDRDRHRHNHPFGYLTRILKGWYDEETPDLVASDLVGREVCKVDRLMPGDAGYGWSEKYHRITDVSPGGVWTLFFMTENTKRWGFDVDGEHVDSVRYFLKHKYPKETIKAVHS